MVPISDLMTAQVEVRLNKTKILAMEKELVWLQGQMGKAQEQVDAARLEAAKLQAEISCMVRRSDLEDVKAQLKIIDTAQRNDSQQHQTVVSEMHTRIIELEIERRETLSAMQV